jgi:hypothetical protein
MGGDLPLGFHAEDPIQRRDPLKIMGGLHRERPVGGPRRRRDPSSGLVAGVAALVLSVSSGLLQSLTRSTEPSALTVRSASRRGVVPGCDGFAPSIAPKLYERRAEQFRDRGSRE